MSEQQNQFRDNLFINIYRHQNFHNLHILSSTNLTNKKILRTLWTKKIQRQKQHEKRLVNVNFHVDNCRQHKDQLQSTQNSCIKENKAFNFEQTPKKIVSKNFRTTHKPIYSAYFNVSKNVYNENIHEDLTKSGILIEKYQDQKPLICNRDPRQFLKSLKIKSNINLYKGNFTKFIKRDITQRMKSKNKKLVNNMELSPWENDKQHSFV